MDTDTYHKIEDKLKKITPVISQEDIKNILKSHHIPPTDQNILHYLRNQENNEEIQKMCHNYILNHFNKSVGDYDTYDVPPNGIWKVNADILKITGNPEKSYNIYLNDNPEPFIRNCTKPWAQKIKRLFCHGKHSEKLKAIDNTYEVKGFGHIYFKTNEGDHHKAVERLEQACKNVGIKLNLEETSIEKLDPEKNTEYLTTQETMKELKDGDPFFDCFGYQHIAKGDAHYSGDASYDGYIVYDENDESFFEEDF